MSLDISKILSQFQALGRSAAEQADELAALVPTTRQALQACARLDREQLQAKLRRAGDRWRGAQPTNEAIDAVFPAPDLPADLRVTGADGSQVYPDRHGAAWFYLINIGSIVLTHGSGDAPQTSSQPFVYFEDQDLYLNGEFPVSSELINGRRDLAELTELARLANDSPSQTPGLALLDNGLLLWLALQERYEDPQEVERILSEYLNQLEAIRGAGVAVAGFVDRPRSANVLLLCHLAALALEEIDPESLRANPYRRLTDRQLFSALLPAGHRSARFESSSPVNLRFQLAGHGMQFFYLNCGPEQQIVRVEIPAWVGENPTYLERVHAGLVEQTRLTGIPYVLIRAHELAVVGMAERQALDQMMNQILLEHGLDARISQKAQSKRWTGRRRRGA